MGIHRFFFRACAATATVALLAASIVTAAQTSSQTTEKSTTGSGSQDPFQTAADKADARILGQGRREGRRQEEGRARVHSQDRPAVEENPPPYVYAVTREKATEPAFSGKYAEDVTSGVSSSVPACAAADAYSPLFSSQHKFDSGTGWPSFWRPFSQKSLASAIDNSNPAEPRMEVMCRRCGAHLGHVFDDNPAAPTGLRYCINSLAIKLEAPEGSTTKTASTNSRTKAKAKTRTTLKTKAKNAPKTTRNSGTSKTADPDPQDPAEAKSSDAKPASPKD